MLSSEKYRLIFGSSQTSAIDNFENKIRIKVSKYLVMLLLD